MIFRHNKGMSLIEPMIVIGLMSIVGLGVGSLIQNLVRSNLSLEQKQLAIQLEQEISHRCRLQTVESTIMFIKLQVRRILSRRGRS